MTEEEAEDGLTPEILPAQQLSILINEGNLEPSKGQFLIEKFADHFKQAAEWAKKAKSIIVTDETQTVNMKMARTGRLFLRDKRLEIENMRKLLKADALKECQVIDRIAHFLKDVITPTEMHLERQEKFVEFRDKAIEDAKRAEIEKRMEEERLAKEKADREELERLRKEREEHEKILAKQKWDAEVERLEAKKKADADAFKIRQEAEEKLQIEKAEREKVEAELRAKQQAELKAQADKIREEERMAKADDADLMIILRKQLTDIKIPQFRSVENKRIASDVESYIKLAILKIKITEEEEV